MYTGYTNDLETRLEKHKAGKGAKYTRSHVPEKIVFSERHYKKTVALEREREIKDWNHKEKIKFIESHNKSG